MDLTWVHRAEAIIAEAKDIHSRIIQLEAENEELRRENKRMGEVIKPQPCTKYSEAATTEWVAKLYEETHEVAQEAIKLFCLHCAQCGEEDEAAIEAVETNLAEELTDVITVCVSWLDALGYDEKARGVVQWRVNEKNKKRGYFGSD
nr:MAG TPA: triphosphate pyrophosphohydrolase [Caudoviricetes sp.]